MPLYTFRCADGHTADSIRSLGTSEIQCNTCGRKAYRQSVYRFAQVTPEIRYHGRDFLEASAEIESTRAELEKREGVPVQKPDFWSEAVAKANALKKAGATSSRDL